MSVAKKFIVTWEITYPDLSMTEVIETISESLDIVEMSGNFSIGYVDDTIVVVLGEVETNSPENAAHKYKHLLLEDTTATFFNVYDEDWNEQGCFDMVYEGVEF